MKEKKDITTFGKQIVVDKKDDRVLLEYDCGKILVGEVAFLAEGIIRGTCAEMGLKIIEIAVNVDHVHLFFQYHPKYL